VGKPPPWPRGWQKATKKKKKKEKKNGFPTIKMQKKDPMPLSSNSNMMNFSHFSRPATLVKANLENIGLMAASGLSSMEMMVSKENPGLFNIPIFYKVMLFSRLFHVSYNLII
jgi:hypothetical protein